MATLMVLLATACTSGSEGYQTVEDIRLALEDQGLECDLWEEFSYPSDPDLLGESEWADAAVCTHGTYILTADTEADHDPDEQIEAFVRAQSERSLANGVPGVFLTGKYWLVDCTEDPAECEEFQRAIGGDLVEIESG